MGGVCPPSGTGSWAAANCAVFGQNAVFGAETAIPVAWGSEFQPRRSADEYAERGSALPSKRIWVS